MKFMNEKMLKAGSFFTVLAFLAVGIVISPLPTVAGEKVAIEVNGETMGRQQLENQIKQQLQRVKAQNSERLEKNPELAENLRKNTKQQIVDQTVQQLVLQTNAKDAGIEVQESEIDQRLEQATQQFPNEEAYEKALDNAGMSEDDFRKKLETELRTQKFVEQNIETKEVSEEEIREHYEQNRQQFGDLSLEEVKSQIVSTLQQTHRDRQVQNLIQELKEESDIEVKI